MIAEKFLFYTYSLYLLLSLYFSWAKLLEREKRWKPSPLLCNQCKPGPRHTYSQLLSLRSLSLGSLGLHPPLNNTFRDVDWDRFESIIQFGKGNYLNNFESSNLWTWHIFSIISVLFNFSQQCFVAFIILVLSIVKLITSYFIFLGTAINGIFKNFIFQLFPARIWYIRVLYINLESYDIAKFIY